MKSLQIALFTIFICLVTSHLFAQANPNVAQNKTLSYSELIVAYEELANNYPTLCKLRKVLKSDNGRWIYEFSVPAKNSNSVSILINNGIHPGEPDGIDASLQFMRELLANKINYPNVTFVCIPVYNVDGFSEQTCCTRANQNGPTNQGFRGNARNLDLNRDFIKADAKATFAFYEIFHRWKPAIFIDNHVSNGADYQYTMTLISTQHNKLGGYLGDYLKNTLEPALFKDMAQKNVSMVPYVNSIEETPDAGIVAFLETPRFSTGFTTLFNCFGFVPETHMLKPYQQRVKATFELLKTFANYANTHTTELIGIRKNAESTLSKENQLPLDWLLDTTQSGTLNFKGYEAKYKKSGVSGQDRLYYDRSAPYKKPIKYFNTYQATALTDVPSYYVIPQAWHQVIALLEANKVEFKKLKKDTSISVNASYITKYETTKQAYEGHYLHYNIKSEVKNLTLIFNEGDLLVPSNQLAKRYLHETLSPNAPDGFFAWNFFDSVLQQKEHYSAYVFEDTAAELLKSNPTLKEEFEAKKKADLAFANSASAQLNFIYKSSAYYESTHMRYPIYTIY